ncbi:alpha-L-rhamnosidase C-terminal domain-containing protein [Streptomyces sp. NPDC102406]|uniref:alpha-L-rhamnosidase C-terminal domain-containing protein n=1 Tax=Streptomyces sp. NPDC102406 TaxID=3366171 RepID=UPI00382AB304
MFDGARSRILNAFSPDESALTVSGIARRTGPSFRPRPGGGITWARTRHETPYGTAALDWELTADGMAARATVPEGRTVTAELPVCTPLALEPGEHLLDTADITSRAA